MRKDAIERCGGWSRPFVLMNVDVVKATTNHTMTALAESLHHFDLRLEISTATLRGNSLQVLEPCLVGTDTPCVEMLKRGHPARGVARACAALLAVPTAAFGDSEAPPAVGLEPRAAGGLQALRPDMQAIGGRKSRPRAPTCSTRGCLFAWRTMPAPSRRNPPPACPLSSNHRRASAFNCLRVVARGPFRMLHQRGRLPLPSSPYGVSVG